MKHLEIKRLLLATCLLATCVSAFAVPISIDPLSISSFRETRFNPPPFFATGDNFLLDAAVDISAGTTMTATNTNTSETFSLDFTGSSYFAFVPYTTNRALGDWTFKAMNGTDTDSETAAALGIGLGTGPVPGVTGLTVSGPLTNPTLTWAENTSLPSANDGNVDRLRTRVQDASGSTVFDSRSDLAISIGLDVTSYTIPTGYITQPGTYYAQVLVEGFDPFIRSRTFHDGFTIAVPEPSIIALFAAGLFGIGFARRRKHN